MRQSWSRLLQTARVRCKMASERKVSVEQLRKIGSAPASRTVMWHGIAVTVRTLLPFSETVQFVGSVLASCYDKSHDRFVPEMKDFAIRANTVLRYACVELPDDFEEQYALLYTTDIYDFVLSVINRPQLDSILETINICIRK